MIAMRVHRALSISFLCWCLLILGLRLIQSSGFVHTSNVVSISRNIAPSYSQSSTFSAPFTTTKQSSGIEKTSTCLQATLQTALLSTPLPSLLILAGIVLIHESGHYLAARMFGIKVKEFSVGVGPKLFGFTALGNEFNLRALPFGGYVRFPENEVEKFPENEVEDIAIENTVKAFEREQEMDFKTKVLKALLSLGSNGDQRRKEAEARRQELKEKKRIHSIDSYDDPDLLQNRPWFQRAVVLSGGVIFNLLLAWAIYFGEIHSGSGLARPVFDSGAIVRTVPRHDAAAFNVLQKGDVITAINGRPITKSVPSAAEAEKGINTLISSIRETPEGESIKLTITHPGSKSPSEVELELSAIEGVGVSPNFVKTEIMKTKNIPQAARHAADITFQLTKAAASRIIPSFRALFTRTSKTDSAPQVSGPIGLIRTGTAIVATQRWRSLYMFAAAVSINLGVVNALPFPALDGGQLLFVLSEAVTGKKVNQRVQEGVTGAALLFLLLFSARVTIGDIRFIFGK